MNGLRGRIERWVMHFLGNTLDHYGSILSDGYGPILRFILGRFFDRIELDTDGCDRIRNLATHGTVVYALQYPSSLGCLFFQSRYRREGLPVPRAVNGLSLWPYQPLLELLRILVARTFVLAKEGRWTSAFWSGYFRRSAARGESQVIFFSQTGTIFSRIFKTSTNPLAELVRAQRESERPIFIVPHLLVYAQTPPRPEGTLLDLLFGEKENPGRIRRTLQILRHHGRAFLQVGEPLDLKEFAKANENMDDFDIAVRARREVLDRIERERKLVFGPTAKSRWEIMETVLRDPEVEAAVQRSAEEQKRSLRKATRAAYRMIDEIASDYNSFYIGMWHHVLRWVWGNIFEGVHVGEEGLARVREIAKRFPIVFVPSHKSHMDYLMLSYVLYVHHMAPPLIAAGVNLSFWPMGHVFRKSGAFFIRRSFKGDDLYSRIFSKYIEVLIREGYFQEFFIEGGRSRTGKLVLPKVGYLSMIESAFQKGAFEDVVFVPVSITYEQVMEEGAYVAEIRGREKKKESLFLMLGNWRRLFRRYGRVYVNFGQAVSLGEYMTYLQGSVPPEKRENRYFLLKNLAYRIAYHINQVAPVTPVALVSAAILSETRRGIPKARLQERIVTYHDYLVHARVPLSHVMANPERALEEVMEIFEGRKFLTRLEPVDERDESVFVIREEARQNIEYYKNNIIHHLLPPIFLATAVLARPEEGIPEEDALAAFANLRDVFRFEFIYDVKRDPGPAFRDTLDYFLSQGFLVEHDAPVYGVAPGAREVLRSFATLLDNFLEGYLLVLDSLVWIEEQGERGMPLKEFIRKTIGRGRRRLETGETEHQEAISEVTFHNCIDYLTDEGIVAQSRMAEERESRRVPSLIVTDPAGRRAQVRDRLAGFHRKP